MAEGEALMGAVVLTMAVPEAVVDSMAGTKAEADSTMAAEHTPAAKVFGTRGQPHHDRRVAARIAGLAARPIVRTSIQGTSADARQA
jgi:hypothetical protein